MKYIKIIVMLMITIASAQAKFIKIDASGQQLPENASQWSCVYDDVKQLLWENKTTTNAEDTYTWYKSRSEVVGTESSGKCKATGRCDTEKYILDIQGLCGAKDWRLPTLKELETLVICPKGKSDNWIINFQCNDYASDGQKIKIDSDFFPNTSLSYWTSESYESIKTSAYYVNYYTGGSERDAKWNALKVRAVRNGLPIIAKTISDQYPLWDDMNAILTIPRFDTSSPIRSAKIKFDFANDSFVVLDVK